MKPFEHKVGNRSYETDSLDILDLLLPRCEVCDSPIPGFKKNNLVRKYCSKECASVIAKRKYNANLLSGNTTGWLKIRFEIFKRDNFICQYCGRNVESGIELRVDHIKPRAIGGKEDFENLVTSCNECNAGKSDSLLSIRQEEKLKKGIACRSGVENGNNSP